MAKLLHCYTHTTYPKVESAIKAPLSNTFHTNIESNDFMQSEIFAYAANYADKEHLTLRLQVFFSVFQFSATDSVLTFYMVESKAANECLIKKAKYPASLLFQAPFSFWTVFDMV